MPAPTKKLYVGVLVVFLLFIPTGLLLHHYGPALVEAWKWRRLGKPLERKGRVVGYVVSSSGYRGTPIRELDLAGKVVREWPARHACYGIEILANGNLLLGSSGKVEELDREGKVVWELPASAGLSYAMDVSRLGNGNTLVADSSGGRVVEFMPEGAEVWSYKCKSPFSAQRLRNGNTLIGHRTRNGRVFEISPAGEVVWEKKGLQFSIHVRRLANGNTLVADSRQGKVIEVDPAGEVVWEYKCSGIVGAERLPDGRTLISSSNPLLRSSIVQPLVRILLVSPDGKEKVLYKGSGGRACAIYEGK